jgi:hypothetical protein
MRAEALQIREHLRKTQQCVYATHIGIYTLKPVCLGHSRRDVIAVALAAVLLGQSNTESHDVKTLLHKLVSMDGHLFWSIFLGMRHLCVAG